MSNVIEQKKQVVDEIAEKLQASNSIVVVDYRGLNVAEVTELRKQLREAGIEFKVYKNTLTRRAVEKLELTDLNDALVGPNAIAFGGEDVVAPAKILNLRNGRKNILSKAYILCCLACFKLQFATLLLLQKLWQIKKKNKVHNLVCYI